MGFLNDDKAKVTYVTEKLKSHFMCRSRREKHLSGIYGYFEGRAGTFLGSIKRKSIRETDVCREICSWKKAKVSKYTIMNRE